MFSVLLVCGVLLPGPLVDDGLTVSVSARVLPSSGIGEAVAGPASGAISVTGVGFPPPGMKGARAKLMARRAAEVVAVRNLATELGYGRCATIRGFRYSSTSYRADGSVEVVVEYLAAGRTQRE
jgi:hypothetical protein